MHVENDWGSLFHWPGRCAPGIPVEGDWLISNFSCLQKETERKQAAWLMQQSGQKEMLKYHPTYDEMVQYIWKHLHL